MFGRSYSAGLLVFVLLFVGQTVFAQKQGTYVQPAKLKVDNVENPGERDEEGNVSPLTEAFYPIGFSKSGKFAYYVEPADEACGCYFAKLVIQDLRTDEILWEHNYEEEPIEGENGVTVSNETIEKHWKDNLEMFSKKLAEHGIVQANEFSLGKSINYKDEMFEAKLDLNIKEFDVYSADGSVELWVISTRKGKKSVYRKIYDPKEFTGFRGAELAGMLKSPFGSDVAVVMVETYRGYEGPPHITKIRIVGSDLTSRFQ
ncbi:MAG: hypothetical protein R2681_14060 [Pyrinomonadaceae bacterium]